MKDTTKTNKQLTQERALSLKEQRLTYREIAAAMGITEGAAQYAVRCARVRLAESSILADRLRVHPGWVSGESRIDATGVAVSWLYWPSIPDEVVWVNAYGTEVTATKDGYLVEAPYVEYSHDATMPFYQLNPGEEAPARREKHYVSDAALIDDLPVIQQWEHPYRQVHPE